MKLRWGTEAVFEGERVWVKTQGVSKRFQGMEAQESHIQGVGAEEIQEGESLVAREGAQVVTVHAGQLGGVRLWGYLQTLPNDEETPANDNNKK